MRINMLLFLSFFILTTHGCVQYSNDKDLNILQDESRVQNGLLGKWKFWGRFSVERNNWIAASQKQEYIYEFRSDGTFSFLDELCGEKTNGSYNIIPATGNSNPYIQLQWTENEEKFSKKILIILIDRKFISIFEHPNEDRYIKQN